MTESTTQDISALLDHQWGGITYRDMTAITFVQMVLNRVNGLKTYDSRVQELAALGGSYFPGRKMADEYKLELLKKLIALGVEV